MSLSKEELIREVYIKYKVLFPKLTDERVLLDVLASKYHRAEVVNLSKGKRANDFDKGTLNRLSSADLKKMIKKHSGRTVPVGVSREIMIDILLGKLKAEKMSDEDLIKFGKRGRNSLVRAKDLYIGWVPKVKRKIREEDLKRGKKEVKKY